MPIRETVSLHCTRGSSDKVYNMQLEPEDDGTWSVYAQNGRRGGTLTERTKISHVTYTQARNKFDEIQSEKIRVKGYVTVALSGKSLPKPATAVSAPKVKLPPLPKWPDLAVSYAEAATYLGQPASLKDDPQAYIVLLVDVAAGAQDGLPDAVTLANECKNEEQLLKLLSDDAQDWYRKLPASVAALALQELQSAIPF